MRRGREKRCLEVKRDDDDDDDDNENDNDLNEQEEENEETKRKKISKERKKYLGSSRVILSCSIVFLNLTRSSFLMPRAMSSVRMRRWMPGDALIEKGEGGGEGGMRGGGENARTQERD